MNKFSIDFAEYQVAEELSKVFKKKDDFSICIPMSRQQKDYDLILYNGNNKKAVSIQVKSSRTYIKEKKDLGSYYFYSWLNRFKTNPNTDYYIIYIPYPLIDFKTFKPKAGFGYNILVFTQLEMQKILNEIKTKKGTTEKFFGFGFDDNKNIFGARGFSSIPKKNFSKYLFDQKIKSIQKKLGRSK